jgi:putative transferase (TIGR04331 family)
VFLATTAFEDFWDTSGEVLFLGTWCLPYQRRADAADRGQRILPSPWNDRARYYATIRQADACYEQLLAACGQYLNGQHGISYGTRAWRALIGPWLWHFVHIIWDRHAHLADALASDPDLRTCGVEPGAVRVSEGTLDLIALATDDPYNLQLCSDLLRAMGHTFPVRDLACPPPPRKYAALAPSLTRRVGRTAGRLLAAVRPPMGALLDMYMPSAAAWQIGVASGLRAWPAYLSDDDWLHLPGVERSSARAGLGTLIASTDPGRLVVSLLPAHFPALYLEAFDAARRDVLAREIALPPVTVSLIGWFYNERFKFMAAESVSRGGRLVAAQHGGGYGILRYGSAERHERAVSDCFLAWGWANGATPGCRNAPNPKISALRVRASRRPSPAPDAPLLFVPVGYPRYQYRFHSMPIGSQLAEYYDWQQRFFENVPPIVRSAIRYREYPQDFGHHAWKRLEARYSELARDRHSTFHEALETARVVIIDNCSTTSLEALAANVPTILFWDPARWEIREDAEPLFDALAEAGVFWRTPEDAAQHLTAIWERPLDWWRADRVQRARAAFVDRFAIGSRDWAASWASAIAGESKATAVSSC